MKELNGLIEFCAVVEHGGFSRAGEALGVSTAYVSRRVSDLEQRLEIRLLHRTTRKVNLTDIGAQYYERAKAILDEVRTLSTDMAEQQGLVKGLIRVSAGGSFGETWVGDALSEFATIYPDIEIELEISARHVDLIQERFDLSIRHGMPRDPDLIVRKIGSRKMMVCASPEYLKVHGIPKEPEDLMTHNCLKAPGLRWMFSRQKGLEFELKVTGRWSSNNGHVLATAARHGLGITRLADTYLKSGLLDKKLVPLLQDFELPAQDTVLCYPTRDNLPYRIRRLIDFLIERGGKT